MFSHEMTSWGVAEEAKKFMEFLFQNSFNVTESLDVWMYLSFIFKLDNSPPPLKFRCVDEDGGLQLRAKNHTWIKCGNGPATSKRMRFA